MFVTKNSLQGNWLPESFWLCPMPLSSCIPPHQLQDPRKTSCASLALEALLQTRERLLSTRVPTRLKKSSILQLRTVQLQTRSSQNQAKPVRRVIPQTALGKQRTFPDNHATDYEMRLTKTDEAEKNKPDP